MKLRSMLVRNPGAGVLWSGVTGQVSMCIYVVDYIIMCNNNDVIYSIRDFLENKFRRDKSRFSKIL